MTPRFHKDIPGKVVSPGARSCYVAAHKTGETAGSDVITGRKGGWCGRGYVQGNIHIHNAQSI